MATALRPNTYPENHLRLSDSLHPKTTSDAQTSRRTGNEAISSDDSTDSKNDFGRCSETFNPQRRLCVSHVSGAKARPNIQTSFQSEKSQCICRRQDISPCKCSKSTTVSSARRLDAEDRHLTSVLSCAYCDFPSTVSKAHLQRDCLRHDMPSVWPCQCTQNFCDADKLGCLETSCTRHESTSLLGRLSFGTSKPSCPCATRRRDYPILNVSGMDNKQRKIVQIPNTTPRVSRNQLAYCQKPKDFANQKDRQDYQPNSIPSKQAKLGCSGGSKAGGNAEFRQFFNSSRSSKLQRRTEVTEPLTERSGHKRNHCASSRRHDLVDGTSERLLKHLAQPSNPLYGNRCFRDRLGCLRRRHSFSGYLAEQRDEFSFQRKGIDRCSLFSSRICTHNEELYPIGSMRQQKRSSIPTKERRHSLSSSSENNSGDLSPSPTTQHLHHSELYPRPSKLNSRQSVEEEDAAGMASTSKSHLSNISKMGRTQDRPDGFSKCACCPELCIMGHKGQERPVSRCLQQALEIPDRLGLPSTLPHAQSAGEVKPSSGHIHHNLPEVGECILESRSQEKGHSSSILHQEPTQGPSRHTDKPSTSSSGQSGIGGMEMSGWSDILTGWTSSQKSLVEAGWRQSTLKTYKNAWDRWLAWCKKTNISPKVPNASSVAQYLVHLFTDVGLAYRTILVHKSVIANFCCPESEANLSSHILIKQVLKGIANKSIKPVKPPIWNPQVVVNYLLSHNCSDVSIFEVSRRCAILLLLASGRRIHDLTLLSIAQDMCIVESDKITFWPCFGSKTDTLNHQQSGWQILSGLDKNIDPVFWTKRLIDLNRLRRNEICNLFLTTVGPVKAASRTIIAGWVRTLLKDSGIENSPGSIRSAVASLNWVEKYKIEDILARGNWQSSNTLLKFYRKPLLQPPSAGVPSVSAHFRPIE